MADIFLRSQFNPILVPEGTNWLKIYNPAAIADDCGQIHLFPRVAGRDMRSYIAHAVAGKEGRFVIETQPSLTPQGDNERCGLEDPRITLIDNVYHMVFAAFDGTDVELHTAVSSSLAGPWRRCGPAVPNFKFIASGGVRVRWKDGSPFEKINPKGRDHRSKSGAIFPSKINGLYYLLFGEFRIWIATSTNGQNFDVIPGPFLAPRKGTHFFDNTFVEMGPPPIECDRGWLVLYHGVNDRFQYQLGYLILDRNDPTKILYRSTQPIFGPREIYEIADSPVDVLPGAFDVIKKKDFNSLEAFYKSVHRQNIMPQVVFCTGTILKDDLLHLYYGVGDRMICTAVAPLADVLKSE